MDRRRQIDWLLRFAIAGSFVGHGAYGAILQKDAWFGYFAVLGISSQTVIANGLFTGIGVAEMGMGLLALAFPAPAALLCLAVWKIFFELLRPAAGEPFWEFVERASNMVAPLALFYIRRPTSLGHWFIAGD